VRARLAALLFFAAANAFAALPGIVSERFEPNVVRADLPSASLKLFIATTGEAAQYRIECNSGTNVLMTKLAGNRFSATIKASDALHGYAAKPAGANGNFFGFLVPLNAAGQALTPKQQLTIRVFDSNVPNVPIADLLNKIRATRRVVNLPLGVETVVPADNVTGRFYFFFGGDFYDFINVVFSNPSFVDNRHHESARADAKGIGKDAQPNDTKRYGSAGALIGVNVFPIVDLFDGGNDAMAHELGHQWINYVVKDGSPHWPPSTMARGLMGVSNPSLGNEGLEFPWEIVPDGAGWKFAGKPLLHRFADLDLYLMGLLPPDKVGVNRVVSGLKSAPCNGCPVNGTVQTLTIAQIVAANGPRVPSAASSKKKFRMATAVFSTAPLSDEEMLLFDYFAGRAEAKTELLDLYGFSNAPFFVATNGLGQLDTTLVWPAKFPMITGVAPAVLPKSGGTFLVNGSGFTADAKVFAQLAGPAIQVALPTKFVGSTQLQATIPAFAGRPTIFVRQASGQVKLLKALASAN